MRYRYLLTLLLVIPFYVQAESKIGIPAKGGYPEYLFLERVSKTEAKSTAKMVSDALAIGRIVIFAQMGKIGDPTLGDKGFGPDVFAKQWLSALEEALFDISANQKRLLDILVWAGKLSMEINQDRINYKGVKYKHFLPAKWARETGLLFNAKTGIFTRQPGVNFRHPSNAPDAREREVLTKFVKAGPKAEAQGEFTKMGKNPVYRYFDPVKLLAPCLACHGKPKGELDVIGFEKDGMSDQDVVGMISVTVGVKE